MNDGNTIIIECFLCKIKFNSYAQQELHLLDCKLHSRSFQTPLFICIKYCNLIKDFFVFLTELTQRVMQVFVINLCSSSPLNVYISIFFSETTEPIVTTLGRNVHLMVLYKVSVFCSDQN